MMVWCSASDSAMRPVLRRSAKIDVFDNEVSVNQAAAYAVHIAAFRRAEADHVVRIDGDQLVEATAPQERDLFENASHTAAPASPGAADGEERLFGPVVREDAVPQTLEAWVIEGCAECDMCYPLNVLT